MAVPATLLLTRRPLPSTPIHNTRFDTRVALGTGVDVTDLAVLKNAPDARTIPSADFSVPFNR